MESACDWLCYRLVNHLLHLKSALKKLNGDKYKCLDVQVENAKKLLDEKQRLVDNPSNSLIKVEAAACLEYYMGLRDRQFSLLQQKAKLDKALAGDKNSRYFHALIKQKRQHKSIWVLVDNDGSRVEGHDNLVHHIVNFYGNLFGTAQDTRDVEFSLRNPIYRVTSAMNSVLTRQVTLVEIINVVFGMDDNKAPGPDGYNACFYKKAWGIVGHLVWEAVVTSK